LKNVFIRGVASSRRSLVRDKRAKFVQLANQRVTKALEQIRLVGNLSNRAAYDFTDDDTKKIVKALQKAVDTAKARFSETGASSDSSFSLEN
jgi:hypothetical protein